MSDMTTKRSESPSGPEPAGRTGDSSLLLTVADVARLLGCSARHVSRLIAKAVVPAPVRLGALVRWSRPSIERWIADGCPQRGRESALFDGPGKNGTGVHEPRTDRKLRGVSRIEARNRGGQTS